MHYKHTHTHTHARTHTRTHTHTFLDQPSFMIRVKEHFRHFISTLVILKWFCLDSIIMCLHIEVQTRSQYRRGSGGRKLRVSLFMEIHNTTYVLYYTCTNRHVSAVCINWKRLNICKQCNDQRSAVTHTPCKTLSPHLLAGTHSHTHTNTHTHTHTHTNKLLIMSLGITPM